MGRGPFLGLGEGVLIWGGVGCKLFWFVIEAGGGPFFGLGEGVLIWSGVGRKLFWFVIGVVGGFDTSI